MEFPSINPYNGEEVGRYTAHTISEIDVILNKSKQAFKSWSRESLSVRTDLIKKAGQKLKENIEDYAQIITKEIGKPISESGVDIIKCNRKVVFVIG